MTRVLLVEDDGDVRLLLEFAFLDAGYHVDTTANVQGGLSLLGCRDYDIVVTDGRLGDGVGMQIADKARDKATPALIVTGYPFDLHGDGSGIDQSRYTVFEKPLRPSVLLSAMEQTLQRRSRGG